MNSATLKTQRCTRTESLGKFVQLAFSSWFCFIAHREKSVKQNASLQTTLLCSQGSMPLLEKVYIICREQSTPGYSWALLLWGFDLLLGGSLNMIEPDLKVQV